MEPLDDRELGSLLKEWRAPDAPAAMRAPRRGWSEFWHASIQVPVPLAVVAAAVVALAIWWGMSARRMEPARVRAVTFTDFQPVERLEPKVIRSGYDNR